MALLMLVSISGAMLTLTLLEQTKAQFIRDDTLDLYGHLIITAR